MNLGNYQLWFVVQSTNIPFTSWIVSSSTSVDWMFTFKMTIIMVNNFHLYFFLHHFVIEILGYFTPLVFWITNQWFIFFCPDFPYVKYSTLSALPPFILFLSFQVSGFYFSSQNFPWCTDDSISSKLLRATLNLLKVMAFFFWETIINN